MPNEYEAALLPENHNEYEDALRLDNADALEGLRASLFEATKHTPDEFAKARRLGQHAGLPTDMVARNFAEVERDARIAEYDSVLTNAPTLGERLRDPEFATLAQDDVRSLAEIEALFNPRLAAGKIGGPAFVRPAGMSATPEQGSVLRHVAGPAGAFAAGAITGTNAAIWGVAEGAAEAFGADRVASFLRAQRKGQEALGARLQDGYGTGGVVEAGVASGFYSFGNMLPATAVAVLTGNPQILLATGSLTAGGQSVGKALDAKQPAWRALLLGAEDSAAEYFTERLPVGRLFKDLKAGSPFLRTLGTQMLLEIPTELAATAWQNFNEWANLHPEQSLQEYLDKLGPDEAQTVIATVVQTALSVGLASGVQRVAQRAQAAQNAEANAQAMDALFSLAGQSALRGRAADAFQQYVEALAPDAQSAFVNPNTLEQAGVDVAALAKASPTFAAQYQTAASTGTEVEIPISELAAALPGSGLEQAVLPYLRIGDADAVTQAEAGEYLQNQEAEFAQGVQEAVAAAEYSDAWKQSATIVENELRAQLQATNRFPDDVTNTYAAWASKLVEVWAARRNVTPEQHYVEYPLDIVGAVEQALGRREMDQQTERFAAPDIESPEFKAWFGDSKVIDDSGKPLVVYRGDRVGKTSFDGKHDPTIRIQGNVFFTSEAAVARGYTPGQWRNKPNKTATDLAEEDGLYRAFLAMRNPIVVDAKGEEWDAVPLPRELRKELKGSEILQIDDLAALARRKGYDGLIVKNVADQYGDSTQYVVFSPTQIKSATRNTGAFDPNDPRIMYQDAVSMARIAFEVAPNPDDVAATERWNALPLGTRQRISAEVAQLVARQAQQSLGVTGDMVTQLGGYEEENNASFSLVVPAANAEKVLQLTRLLGYALSQKAMAVTSPTAFDGGDKWGAVVVTLHDKATDANLVADLYGELRGNVRADNGDALVNGHTTADGSMVILVPAEVADEAVQKVAAYLGERYVVGRDELFVAWPEQGVDDYGIRSENQDTGAASLRDAADRLRAFAAGEIEQRIAAAERTFDQSAYQPGAGSSEPLRAPDAASIRSRYGNGAEQVVGIHYSNAPRSRLDGYHYGQGAKGAEAQRLAQTDDARLRQRIHFYVDEGQGVRPESGVGAQAHAVVLSNLYDVGKDALGLARGADRSNPDMWFNAVETAVLDAGFAGVYVPGAQGAQGVAVLLGAHSVPVDHLGAHSVAASTGYVAPDTGARKYALLSSEIRKFEEQQAAITAAAPSAHVVDGTLQYDKADEQKLAAFFPGVLRTRSYNQPAYHGTHAKGITKFSTEFIGTGEGVQAFGWGLYFASDRSIAEHYRQKLTDATPIKTFRIGTLGIFRNEMPVDYSPRDSSPEAHARANATEYLMLREPDIREAWYAEGINGVRKIVQEELDALIARFQAEYPAYVPELKALRRRTDSPTLFVFEMSESEGQTYEVDIPHHDEYLDWDKPLTEQSKKVKEVLATVGEEEGLPVEYHGGASKKLYWPGKTGRDLYQALSAKLESAEAASKVLNSYGIAGIRYLDGRSRDAGEGSHNYVVFDDEAIRIAKTFYQRQQAPRGQITFGEDITKDATRIALLEDADLTTFLHEIGHFQLEVLSHVAAQPDAPAEVRADMDVLLRWFGVPDMPTWQAMTFEQRRAAHEQFARGFEAYLFEGNAPTPELTSLFGRLRAWLLHIYRSLAALNVELTDEVRGVMGRMLATNEQIEQAEAVRSMAPLLQEAPAGVDPETWARYQADGALATQAAINDLQSRSLRDMQWLTNAKSRELRRLQRQTKDLRAEIEAEVTQEVRQQPIYAARRFLAYGELAMPDPTNAERKVLDRIAGAPTKLDLGSLKDMYGEGPAAPWRYLPTGKHGLAAVDGLHPDLVAQLFGFSSGDALVRELIGAFPEKATIEGLTDQRMLERYGDLSSDDALARAAESAIHNEARARFVATEYKIATRSATPVQVIAAAAKDMATKAIAQKRIRDLKPAQFAAAEARAAKAAERALGASDAAGFAREVRNKLLNNALAREAGRAASDVAKIVRHFKKFNDGGVRKNIDIDYRDQIDAILERFDLREGQTLKAIDKRKSLAAWIEQQEEMGLSPTIDERVRDEAFRKHFRDMTVEELRGLYDSVRSIEHLGRLKTKLLTAVDQREFAAAVEAITTSIQDNAKRVVPEQRMSDRGVLVEGKRMFKGFLADHRKLASVAREMDGWQDGGVLWEYLIRPMNSAGNKEAVMREQATVHLGELLKPLLRGESLAKKTYFPDIGKSFSREERIGIALNVGNEINRERIMSGEKLNPAQLQTLLDSLSKEEWDVVQGVWDYLESFRPAIAEKERRITGVEPQWVEAAPVATRHGTYRGGYYPIKYDPLRSTRSGADTAAEVQRQIERGLYARSQTRRGHLKARVETTGRSIRYDLGVLTEHVTQVIHDLAWHEYLIDANRLVRSGAIDAAIREHYGPEVIRTIRDTLRDIAQGELPAQSVAESWLNHIRHGATIAGLGWRITTSLLQPIGLTQSMVRIGPMWVLRGARHWLGDAVRFEGAVKAVMDKSDFMRLRSKTLQREINEIRNKVAGKDSMLEASYFYFIQKMQLIADLPTWYGAYDKAMAQEDMTEAKAIALADQAVIDAQGSGQIKDLSQVQRGSAAWKLFTNFYSFFNTTYNLTAEAVGRTNFKSPASIALLGVDLLLLYTIPAMLGTIMKAALAGDLDDEDKLLRRLAAEQISYLFGTMVLLREAGAVAGNVIDPKHGYGYTGPAGVRFFTELSALSQQIGQGEADEAFWKHLNSTAGVLFQYPAGQINATLDGVIALSEGRTDNPGALIVGTPRE